MRANYIRIAIMIAAIIAANQLVGCNSGSDWDEAQQAGSHEAYENYIENNPGGEYVAEAQAASQADSTRQISLPENTSVDLVTG
ncbi:MAG: hypothetical protein WD510_01170, partial [Balneolaceae bacterium]